MSASRSHPLRDFGLAISLLSAVPTPARWSSDAEKSDVAGWFPLVGVAFGVVTWGVLWLERLAPAEALLVAVAAVAVEAILTRGLHWDGLADVADAWAADDLERRHEILKDSHIGAFGALAIGIALLALVSAYASLAAQGAGVLAIEVCVAGRLAATFSAWIGKPARDGGLGASVMHRPSLAGLVSTVAAVACATAAAQAVGGVHGFWTMGAASALALVVPDLIARRFGGVTGDTMGASVVLVQVLVAVMAAVVIGA